jgi:hypothetical protein
LVLVLAPLSAVEAVTLTAEWTPQTHLAETVHGTRIYQDSSAAGPVAEVAGVAKNAVTFPAPTDGLCHNYWAVNYNAAGVSPNSAVVAWCPPAAVTDPPPPEQPPTAIPGFKVTTVTTVTPLP